MKTLNLDLKGKQQNLPNDTERCWW